MKGGKGNRDRDWQGGYGQKCRPRDATRYDHPSGIRRSIERGGTVAAAGGQRQSRGLRGFCLRTAIYACRCRWPGTESQDQEGHDTGSTKAHAWNSLPQRGLLPA